MKFVLVLAALVGCALAFPEERVVGGSPATQGQFPHLVSMQWGLLGIWQHICGASIISTRTMLTAAHCITESPGLGSFRVRAGNFQLNTNVATQQVINVQRNVIHPDYAGGVNPHDIALLILVSPLSYNANIQPINLPVANSIPTGMADLSGWGSTSTSIIPSMPNTKQHVRVPVLTWTACANALTALFGTSDPLHNNNVCTGPLTGGVSACSGDSGGGLTEGGNIIGIVSWGVMPCGSAGAPSVYGRVSAYVGWIQTNMIG